MQLEDKLAILADSAKYDVACTSSGVDRAGVHGKLGCSVAAGICHSFTPDGRCISLLKVLYSNACCYDCGYCVNRRSNDVPRATFTPRELAELTIGFYKRNYIEGLFLSSAVIGTPDYTMERMIEALRILRQEYHSTAISTPKPSPARTRNWCGVSVFWRTGFRSILNCPAKPAFPCWLPIKRSRRF